MSAADQLATLDDIALARDANVQIMASLGGIPAAEVAALVIMMSVAIDSLDRVAARLERQH